MKTQHRSPTPPPSRVHRDKRRERRSRAKERLRREARDFF